MLKNLEVGNKVTICKIENDCRYRLYDGHVVEKITDAVRVTDEKWYSLKSGLQLYSNTKGCIIYISVFGEYDKDYSGEYAKEKLIESLWYFVDAYVSDRNLDGVSNAIEELKDACAYKGELLDI